MKDTRYNDIMEIFIVQKIIPIRDFIAQRMLLTRRETKVLYLSLTYPVENNDKMTGDKVRDEFECNLLQSTAME